MPLSTEDIERLATEWTSARARAADRLLSGPIPDTSNERGWEGDDAEQRVSAVLREGSEDAWRLLKELVRSAPDDDALAYLGAGPVEDFVSQEVGTRFEERISEQLASDRRFRVAFSSAWGLPLVLQRLVEVHPPGPDPADSTAITEEAVRRYILFRRGQLEAAAPGRSSGAEGALGQGGLNVAEARKVGVLVAAILRVLRAPEALAGAKAWLESAAKRRAQLVEQMRAMATPGLTLALPALDAPEVQAWFAERDEDMRERMLHEVGLHASAEEVLAALRRAWGDSAVDAVLAHADELASLQQPNRLEW